MNNTLEITKEIKQVTFKYVADTYEFVGTCNITSDKKVTDISTNVSITGSVDGAMSPSGSIGSCSSNGSTNVNIYNDAYKHKIDEVAHYFMALQTDLENKYSTATFSEIV